MRCLALLVLVPLFGCDPASDVDPNLGPEADYSRYRAFADEIRGAGTPVLYEGLPSDFTEGELLKKETAKGIHVEIEGELFYKETLTLGAEDAKRLTGMLSGNRAAIPYGGPKACGPFHADYGLEWTVDEQRQLAMICFTCHEIAAIGPGNKAIADMSEWGFQELKKILQKYRRSRPSSTDIPLLSLSLARVNVVSVHSRKRDESETVGRVEMSRSLGNLETPDREAIVAILLDRSSFKEHEPKKCIFNPDYGLKWKDETDEDHQDYAILLCFTCSEIKCYRGKFETHLDLSNEAKESFERLLAKYK